jgi:hypothetical protein
MVATLKPGGWLLLEEADPGLQGLELGAERSELRGAPLARGRTGSERGVDGSLRPGLHAGLRSLADFVVTFSNGRSIPYTGEGSRYSLDDDVLTIHDGQGQRLHFSPSSWLTIQEDDIPTESWH